VLASGRRKDPEKAVGAWLAAHRQPVEALQRTVNDMRTGGVAADFPTLSVALQAVRRLAEA
jgi:NAD-specific glutamate dehydrogenase